MNLTYGLEIELGDVDRKTQLPNGLYWSSTEHDIVNSNGVAIDPTGKKHTLGGEINTAPTEDIEGQVTLFKKILELFPNATINHRHHTHAHVSFQNLKEEVVLQKAILKFAKENSEWIMNKIFTPTRHPLMNRSAWSYQLADRTVMPDWKYDYCMSANTPEEFKQAHQKVKDGRILPQTTKRYGVNLFSIHKHGTVEFRWFYPTLNPEEIHDILLFCKYFILDAITGSNKLIKSIDSLRLPKECKYNNDLEMGWQSTSYKVK